MGLSDAPFKSRDNKNTRTTRATPSSLPQAARLQTNKQKGRGGRRGAGWWLCCARAARAGAGAGGCASRADAPRAPTRAASRCRRAARARAHCAQWCGPCRRETQRGPARAREGEEGAGGVWVAADAGARKSPPKKLPRHAPASRCPWTPCGRAPCAQKRRQRRRVRGQRGAQQKRGWEETAPRLSQGR